MNKFEKLMQALDTAIEEAQQEVDEVGNTCDNLKAQHADHEDWCECSEHTEYAMNELVDLTLMKEWILKAVA